MRYKVTKQYARGPQSPCGEFADINEAHSFIEKNLRDDAALNVKVIYRIVEFGDVLKEYDPNKMDITSMQQRAAQDQGSQGRSSTASFKPTPFNTTPRPAGSPQGWLKDDEDEPKK
jgi:hypothetical protein